MALDNRPAPTRYQTTAADPKVNDKGRPLTNVKYSRGQIVATCIEAAGFRGDQAMLLMLQVAWAESAWNFTAVSNTGDYGLFQINKRAWGKLFETHDWKNPLQNAQMARKVYDQQGIKAWSTFNNGSYKRGRNVSLKALEEYKILREEHRLQILEAYKAGTPTTRALGFAGTVATTTGVGVIKEVGDQVTPDNLSGVLSSISGLGTSFQNIANNTLAVVIAVVLLVLGVVILVRSKGK